MDVVEGRDAHRSAPSSSDGGGSLPWAVYHARNIHLLLPIPGSLRRCSSAGASGNQEVTVRPFRLASLWLALSLIFASNPAVAQAAADKMPAAEEGEPDLAALLAPFVHPLTVDEGRLKGPGAELLLREAEEAHFFLFGEQHATADIADLAAALVRDLVPRGYYHAVIEVGPAGARRLESLLRDEDPEALARYFATGTNLFSIPFYSFREEAAVVRALMETSPAPAPVLWGLDQEFVAGAGPALDRLAELAATDAERAAVERARNAAAANPMYLGTAPAEELEQLAAAFEGSSSAEARELAERMVASNRIYGPFTGRGGSVYEANREREHLMKENFLARYRPVRAGRDAPPKVFVKLGANHLFRGLAPTHVLSTGTFLDELAVTEGVRTYSVHVDCRGGEALNVMTDAPEPCESYFLGSGSALAEALPPTGPSCSICDRSAPSPPSSNGSTRPPATWSGRSTVTWRCRTRRRPPSSRASGPRSAVELPLERGERSGKPEAALEGRRDRLVLGTWCRRHAMGPLDELVAPTVLREMEIVLVGQLDRAVGDRHSTESLPVVTIDPTVRAGHADHVPGPRARSLEVARPVCSPPWEAGITLENEPKALDRAGRDGRRLRRAPGRSAASRSAPVEGALAVCDEFANMRAFG